MFTGSDELGPEYVVHAAILGAECPAFFSAGHGEKRVPNVSVRERIQALEERLKQLRVR